MSFVTEYLEARGVPYEVVHHDPSVSSLEEAGAVHVDADHVLKAVVIATLGGRAVAVIRASRRLDMHLVEEALADRSAYLATEDELQRSTRRSSWAAPPRSGGSWMPRRSSIPACSNATRSCSPPAPGRSPFGSTRAISSAANTPPSFGSRPNRRRPR